MRWLALVVVMLASSGFCAGQNPDTQQRLEAVRRYATCLQSLAAVARTASPPTLARNSAQPSPSINNIRMNANQMVNGLTTNWGRENPATAATRLPASYANHLQEAAATCEATLAQARRDLAASKKADVDIDAYAADLALIVEDCRKFGMGREIPLEIRIQNNGVMENGWSVFYKWLPGATKFDVHEVPFPNPTPDARQTLWPGLYVVRAEKSVNGSTIRTASRNVPVSGAEKVVFTIAVP